MGGGGKPHKSPMFVQNGRGGGGHIIDQNPKRMGIHFRSKFLEKSIYSIYVNVLIHQST